MTQAWTFRSLLGLRCPRCGADSFKTGFFKTAPTCSACGMVFDQGSGFYAGAIYPFYGGAAILGGIALLICTLVLDWSFEHGMLLASLLVLLATPWLFWYSRLTFIHTNHRFFGEDA